MKRIINIAFLSFFLTASACTNNKEKGGHSQHETETVQEIYTCPMHPEIVRNKPGNCPICGMKLIKKETGGQKLNDESLETILKPTNEFVISSISVVTIRKEETKLDIEALGNITYDTRYAGSISSKVSGRIEKLYVRFRYQKITKGQRIMDIYSPELMTAQQNLLFILKNDAANTTFIQAAKEKLLLLGMSNMQLKQVIRSGKPSLTITVYSNYNGHIHDAAKEINMNNDKGRMRDISIITEELSLKEGMYLQKGQSIFSVYNPDHAWVILNIYAEYQGLLKKGNSVRIIPETAPNKDFISSINFIEPYYQNDSKTLTARVYFNNSALKIPIGSQVRAIIFSDAKKVSWIPAEAVVSLGIDKVVFLKTIGGFKAHKVSTGVTHKNHIQILSGINETDSVAVNGQYLMDSESFIKIKN